MAKIETYSSLEEKGEAFEQTNIKTKVQLDEIIESYTVNVNKNLLFRGCNEARYKLYNKAQREWLSKELYNLGFTFEEFITNEIKNAKSWQADLLMKYFSAFRLLPNDLMILGFLQHYGAPTTLLDWTYSFKNSLFFATDRLKLIESDNEIDNYFSVYIIDNEKHNIPDYIEDLKYETAIVSPMLDYASDKDKKSKKEMLESWFSLEYNVISKSEILVIPGYQENSLLHENKKLSFNLVYNQQNLNIINQQGLFIFNNTSDKPLEFICNDKPYLGIMKRVYNKIRCLNIHKSLFEYTKKRLNEHKPFPINREFIYPQEELIAKNAFNQFLNFDYKNNE
jgi:hypothetical protein